MRTIGIVRRMDELGRIVIPKEIRNAIKAKEGDAFELFVENGRVVLSKYSPMTELKDVAKKVADSLRQSLGHAVYITDMDTVIYSTERNKNYENQNISYYLENIMEERTPVILEKMIPIIVVDSNTFSAQLVVPITLEGDVIGSIVVVSKEKGVQFGEIEKKAALSGMYYIVKELEI